MPQTLTNLLTHVVFSTKAREPHITSDLMPRLHPYLGALVSGEGGVALSVGGVEDHVHLLIRTPPRLAMSDVVRVVKTVSSKWVHDECQLPFAWQSGFAAFSVSASGVEEVLTYIARQREHHQKMTFKDEYRAFLKRNGIAFDERYVWD